MKRQIMFLLPFLFLSVNLFAQKSPVKIKYTVMNLNALRYYPFQTPADSIIRSLITGTETQALLQSGTKTSVYFMGNKEFISEHATLSLRSDHFRYKSLVRPYVNWLPYAAPLKGDSTYDVWTLDLRQETINQHQRTLLQNEGIFGFLGKQNIDNLIDGMFKDIDLFRPDHQVMSLSVQSPLTEEGMNLYRYFLSSGQQVDGQNTHEIVFYPKDINRYGFAGYLYVTQSEPYRLVKAVFSLSNSYSTNFIRDILFIQTFFTDQNKLLPLSKESYVSIGDEIKASMVVKRSVIFTDSIEPLTASEQLTAELVSASKKTPAYNRMKTVTRLLLTDHYSIDGERGIAEVGPVTRMLSYNYTEGFRFRLGGNTTLNLNKHWLLGGYVAYGLKDRQWKYRGDAIYSFLPKDRDIWEFPKRLLSFTYINDLNIPGEDILTTQRDLIVNSFSHRHEEKMAEQTLALLNYEHEWSNGLSFQVGGKYLKDRPIGSWAYRVMKNNIPETIKELVTTEINLSLRYSPHEVFFQTREKRRYLRRASIELNLKHRIGLKNILGSDYNYHITDIDAYKQIRLPDNRGKLAMKVSGRKVWSRLPFPFLFVSGGNQGFLFKENEYNLMDYSEFVTDRFIGGNMNLQFNWSPFHLFINQDIKTDLGAKAIYGPMSDQNNPDIHSGLFVFNDGIKPLGDQPYVEASFGFSNILKIFCIEWVQRFTYLKTGPTGKKKPQGSIFVNARFSF